MFIWKRLTIVHHMAPRKIKSLVPKEFYFIYKINILAYFNSFGCKTLITTLNKYVWVFYIWWFSLQIYSILKAYNDILKTLFYICITLFNIKSIYHLKTYKTNNVLLWIINYQYVMIGWNSWPFLKLSNNFKQQDLLYILPLQHLNDIIWFISILLCIIMKIMQLSNKKVKNQRYHN